jgi:hypothetical protein
LSGFFALLRNYFALFQAVLPNIPVSKDFYLDTLLCMGFSGRSGPCCCVEHHGVPRAALS